VQEQSRAVEAAGSDADERSGQGGLAGREKFYFRSIFLFKLDNPFRRACLELIHTQAFDNFIMSLIATNAACMALEDPMEDPDAPSALTTWLEELDFAFLLAFTAEMAIKVVALGFVAEKHTYLRSGWNILDATIVGTAWLPYFLPLAANSSGMRAFRLLRPLRTIGRFPGLKRLVTAILLAIPQLGNLMLLVGLFFVTLGIVGVQLWAGRWRMRCHNVVLHPSCETYEGAQCIEHLEFQNDASLFCDIDRKETWDETCGIKNAHCEYHDSNPFFDIMSFDSVLDAFPIIMQILTLASWQQLMHISLDTSGLFSVLFYLSGVLLGAYFMMNLFVAVIKDKFDVASAVGAEGADAFEGIDESGDGLLDLEEIGRIFLKNGVYLSDEELVVVFAKIDDDGSGEVDLDEFIGWLRGPSSMAAKLRTKMAVDGSKNDDDGMDDDDDPIESAKKKLTKLAEIHGVVDWSVLFNYYDRKGDGELQFSEFKAALRRDAYISPQQMPAEKLRALFEHIDDDGGGTVSISEFEAWMQQGPSKTVSGSPRHGIITQEDEDEEDVQARTHQEHREKAGAAVRELLKKVSLEMLHVTKKETVDAVIDKSSTKELIDSFVNGHGIRNLFVHYQPRVVTDKDGNTVPKGPPYVTISGKQLETLIGNCVKFEVAGTLWSDASLRLGGPNLETVMEDIDYSEIIILHNVRKFLRDHVIQKTAFTAFFAFCIIFNIVALCCDHHGISDDAEVTLIVLNDICTILFTVEMCCKMMGMTAKEYWSDYFNIFDTFVVVSGLLEILALVGDEFNAFRVFRVFRLFRVLRVLRIISFLNPLRVVFDVLLATLSDLFYILLLTFMFVFIFSILGMQMFGNSMGGESCIPTSAAHDVDCSSGFLQGDENSCERPGGVQRDCEYENYLPRWHFNSFSMALFTTFQVMTYDSWNAVMYDAVRYNGPLAILYFVAWIVGGSLVLMNLLLVIILECYVKEEDKAKKREQELQQLQADKQQRINTATLNFGEADEEELMVNPLAEDSAFVVPLFETESKEDEYDGSDKAEPEQEEVHTREFMFAPVSFTLCPDTLHIYAVAAADGKSLGLFSRDNQLRQACIHACVHSAFDIVVLIVILANCVTMGMETPFLDIDPNQPRSTKGTILLWCDIAFTFIFTGESMMRSIAFGFVRGHDAYLSSQNADCMFNRLDFSIVIISWVDFVATGLGIGFLKSLRLLRAFRALRMLNRIKGLQQLVMSLGRSLIALSNVIGVTLLFWLVFGLLGLNSFKGLFYSCNDKDAAIEGAATCVGVFIQTDAAGKGVLMKRQWTTPPVNFDRIDTAMYTLYECSSQNDWIAKAHHAMDGTAIDKQPLRENNAAWGLFFIIFIVVNNFFLLNLFVGVIYEKYISIRMAGLEMLTVPQRQWLSIMRHLEHVQPTKTQSPSNPGRAGAFKIATSTRLDSCIMGVIVFNCAVMAMKYYDESESWRVMQVVANEICTIIFTVEAALKIFAFGPRGYFRESWNVFDFVVVCGSWLDLAMRFADLEGSINSAIFRIVRIARVVGRVGRLFKMSKNLQGLQVRSGCSPGALVSQGC
jgi:Ca2+-binding EF-hand superfamily protein